ncbi:MAG: DUF2268 domain-containing protein [Bacillus sp. (in: Bacteria)]|nr:DUF2268 domain-containing protein [Bacillus sp. (in: firmicutes)]
MAIVHTENWLKELYAPSKEVKGIPPFFQLMRYFPDWSKEEWLLFLINQGMLPLREGSRENLHQWHESGPEKGVTETLTRLKKTFMGPDVDVFLFPLNMYDDRLLNVMNGKTGISFPEFILLFFQKNITLKEKQALLLHEYHHASRLHHHENNEETVTLLESMVMEGMAEWEVNRLLGEKYVSRWMRLYSDEFLLSWWNKKVKGRKDMKGREHHLPYMYGGRFGFPQWLGYSIGYRMVESYMEKKKRQRPIDLLKTPASVIYESSCFYSK